MKKKYNIIYGAFMALGLVSCSNEAPFTTENSGATGRVLTSSLSVEVKNQTPTTRVQANGIPEPKDFTVGFYQKSDLKNPVKEYTSYGSMPEIVELQEGDYIVKVIYGGDYGEDGVNSAFNAPFYEGES